MNKGQVPLTKKFRPSKRWDQKLDQVQVIILTSFLLNLNSLELLKKLVNIKTGLELGLLMGLLDLIALRGRIFGYRNLALIHTYVFDGFKL